MSIFKFGKRKIGIELFNNINMLDVLKNVVQNPVLRDMEGEGIYIYIKKKNKINIHLLLSSTYGRREGQA